MHHRGRHLHARLLGGAAFLALSVTAVQAHAEPINIKAQPLATALPEFGAQSGVTILASPDVTGSKLSQPVTNVSNPDTALRQMLRGTGLTYTRSNGAYLIVRADTPARRAAPSVAAAEQIVQADEGGSAVEALIVTAQKKEEAIQDVPIAISAFTQKSLDAQKLEGGFDLLKAIPNVTFSKSNFTGYNFSIRGVGTKAISATTDPGVAVAFNNSTLIVNRLFEQEYFDVERVEVLRGPQGTLYGRNATAGVINVISAKPRIGEFAGDLKLETGNYNAQRAKGMVNIPLGDTLALRVAGAMTKRDGFGTNLTDGSDVDDRDLWSTRATLGWEPNHRLRVNLLWERFHEDDGRVRTSKQLCHRDPGLSEVGVAGVGFGVVSTGVNGARVLNQGCLAGSLYDDEAFGTPNGYALPFVLAGSFAASVGEIGGLGISPGNPDAPCAAGRAPHAAYVIDICAGDPYGSTVQSRDLRAIESIIEPRYRARADLIDLSIDFELTEALTLTSQTVYNDDEVYSTQDLNRFRTVSGLFEDTSVLLGALTGLPSYYAPLAPGGVYTDPQLGPADRLLAQDVSMSQSKQFNQELRLASNFDGPVNFSLGANYTRFSTQNDYFVFANLLSYLAQTPPFEKSGLGCRLDETKPGCLYIDPNPLESIDGQGHNYFRSANPYRLTSVATFGELYWQATQTVKVTAGMRLTWDRKTFTPLPSQTLLPDYREGLPLGIPPVDPGDAPEECTNTISCPLLGNAPGGKGYPADPDIVQEWREPTGRLVVDWKPELGFTDETMLYASIAHGYKGGGANPPSIAAPSGLYIAGAAGAVAPRTFEPEFVNAFELGTKNTLLGGALVLNGNAFYYDYSGYQISKIVDRSAANENFDATIWGLEVEWIFSPTRNLRFNGTFGHLDTEIAKGEQSIDLMDRVQGGHHSFGGYDDWVVFKPWVTFSSNCIAPSVLMAAILANTSGNIADLLRMCPAGNGFGTTYQDPSTWVGGVGGNIPGMPGVFFNPAVDAPNGGAGFFADVGGNELPNAPHWTASLGAQYGMDLPGGWNGTLRGDFYWQSQSFARVYNTQYDKLRAWTNANVSLWFEQSDWGVTAEVYVKNVFDETPLTDAFLYSDDTALVTNIFTLDPRLVGVSIRKSF